MARDLCQADATSPCRETLGLMPPGTELLMYLLFAVALVFFVAGFWFRWSLYKQGKKPVKLDRWGLRFRRFAKNGIFQARTMRKRFSGPMHALIFWGFMVLLIGTILVGIDFDISQPLYNVQFLQGTFYLFFEFALDFAGVLLIIGLGMAVWRRTITRPEALRSSWQDALILTILLVISVSGYLLEALRLSIREPDWAAYSFVAAGLVPLVPAWSDATLLAVYRSIWWTHAILVFGFISMIPYTKLHHMLTSPANILVSPLYEANDPPKGRLPTPFDLKQVMETGNFDGVSLGAKKLEDFSWRDLMTVDACTECGRCQEACPAYAAGRPLSPMQLVLDLRKAVHARKDGNGANAAANGNGSSTGAFTTLEPLAAGQASQQAPSGQLVDDVIAQETLWSCVTCRACMDACPVNVDHVPLIVEMRRGLVADMRIDKQKQDLLTNLANTGNAYGLPAADRAKWAADLEVPIVENLSEPVQVLYWVGCSGSYDSRNQKVSRAIVRLLKHAGVKFAILGPNERCTGDPARRLGEESRFQELALSNIEAIKASGARRIITQCPHCFNAFLNEYPEFGLDITVEHHSQYINRLVKQGRLSPGRDFDDSITYHEPCYLGRYNDEYESARGMLKVIRNCELREMHRTRENSFCCGAGGANMWFDVKQETSRISGLRFEEAMDTGAKRVATACPFCLTMLDDAQRVGDETGQVLVQDVAEILAEATLGLSDRLKKAPEAPLVEAIAEPDVPFVVDGYLLYERSVDLKSGRRQTIYFFAKRTPKSGHMCPMPGGYEVGRNPRTRMPFLRKSGKKPKEAPPPPPPSPAPSGIPFVVGDYTLYRADVELKSGRTQRIYFFSKRTPKSGDLCAMPDGFEVGKNPRTGMPFLRRVPPDRQPSTNPWS